jgi:hypothetical protein
MLNKKVVGWIGCFMFIFIWNINAQTERYQQDVPNPYHPPTNLERYQVDYEIKTWTNVNDSLVAFLDLEAIEEYRALNQRVEIIDIPTGLTIIIYAVAEAGSKKAAVRNTLSENLEKREP